MTQFSVSPAPGTAPTRTVCGELDKMKAGIAECTVRTSRIRTMLVGPLPPNDKVSAVPNTVVDILETCNNELYQLAARLTEIENALGTD